MNYFLAKTDPDTYSVEDFQAEKQTLWDGVRNAQAQQAIRQMRPNDRVFLYHSGGESAVVALAEVASAPVPDPADPKASAVQMRFLHRLEPPVTLAEIKAEPKFAEWVLVRQSRLSTMAAPPAFVTWMKKRYGKGKI